MFQWLRINPVFFILMLIILLTSCKGNHFTNFSGKNCAFDTSSRVKIFVRNAVISYKTTSTHFDLVAAYNGMNHSLDLFNLSENKLVTSHKLDSDGPDGISMVRKIYFYSTDSIFLFSENKVFIVDTSFSDLSVLPLPGEGRPVSGFNPETFFIHWGLRGVNPYYFNGSLYLPCIALNEKIMPGLKPLCCIYDIHSGSAEILFIPGHIKDPDSWYGVLDRVIFSGRDSFLYFGFNYSPDIYRVSLPSGKFEPVYLSDVGENPMAKRDGSMDYPVFNIMNYFAYHDLKITEEGNLNIIFNQPGKENPKTGQKIINKMMLRVINLIDQYEAEDALILSRLDPFKSIIYKNAVYFPVDKPDSEDIMMLHGYELECQ